MLGLAQVGTNKGKGSLEEGAVDKLLVGELGEDRVQHGDGHQD